MNITLRIFLIILLLVFLALVFLQINKKKISMRYASLWIIIIFLLIIVTIFPGIIIKMANLLGFETTSNMVFLLGFFVLAYLIFVLTTNLSKANEKNKNLVQELSILKKKIEELENRKKVKND